MDKIKRIDFQRSEEIVFDFEIVDMQEFFKTRPAKHLSKAFRLNFYMILYITSGKGQHEIDFKVYDYKKGDIIFIAQNQVHRFFPDTQATGYIVLFTEEFLFNHSEGNIQDFLEHFNITIYDPIIEVDVNQYSSNRILIDLLYKEFKAVDSNIKLQLLKSLLRSFLLTIYTFRKTDERKENSAVYKRFMEFKKLVEMHYKENKSVVEYADMMLVSQKTINQATRMVVGLSAKQFIIERILLEIKRYLGQGELSVSEISDLMGFDEPSNLTKYFKHYQGVSPKEFRTEYNKN